MKLTKTKGNILFVLLVSIAMTAVMSFGILLIRLGWQGNFLKIWLGDFLIGCCLSIPTGFTIVPLLKKLVDRLTVEG
ncbi:DUF2798 domain-containing protein [Algoriphagus formosus]|uniref:DUF2798 domain-containing protein n=1 Tax=Algoriphagus formosus TaxID=2007308 RepID=A0A4R5V7L2_9BACT|nr:DUF2798 domain-containing protein [Algoriphagus aquimaris]TDK47924.1 DUF2798 domain-containing protein [Algoriphagus aquimaris]